MRILDLFEKRSNPKLNPKGDGHKEAIKFLSNISPEELYLYGVSMTKIPKLGINPSSTYNTPLGVYFYPAGYYLQEKKYGGAVPFNDDAPYIQVLKVSGNPLDLSELSISDRDSILERLADIVLTEYKSTGISSSVINAYNEQASDQALVPTPAGELWYIIYKVSSWISRVTRVKSSIIWNKLLRLLGYDYVIDDTGVIHDNEKTQGFVLKPSAIKLIKTFTNTDDDVNDYPTLTAKSSKADVDKMKRANAKGGIKFWTTLINAPSDEPLKYITHVIDSLMYVTGEEYNQPNVLSSKHHLVRKITKLIKVDPSIIDKLSGAQVKILARMSEDNPVLKHFYRKEVILKMWSPAYTKELDQLYSIVSSMEKNETDTAAVPRILYTMQVPISRMHHIKPLLVSISDDPRAAEILTHINALDDLIKKYT